MAGEGGEPAGVSFAFSAPGKKGSRKVEVQVSYQGLRKEVVTGFGQDGLQTAEPAAPAAGPKVIPKQENTYRSGPAKFAPSYLPEAADRIDAQGIDKFETAKHDTAQAQQEVTYGLTRRERPADAGTANGRGSAGGGAVEAEVLKADLANLPPEAPMEAYEAMPVEAFGEALLRGMGWSEGRAVGRNVKEEVKAKDLVRRPHRLGLGAAPAPEAPSKKKIKPGETRDSKDLVYVDSNGVVKASKPVDAPLLERQKVGVHPGKRMRVAGGRHSGLDCEVMALEPREEGRSERARVRLLPSHETVVVRCSDLDEARKETAGRRREREGRNGSAGGASECDAKKQRAREEPEEQPWLMPNIRVKVVDKRVAGGRLYLKKGMVVDVKAPTLCDVHFEEIGETVLDVRQSQLESVVPAAEGTPLLILHGKLKGRLGRLLQRSTTSGMAAVQLVSDFSVHKLPLDDISEYCGPMDGAGD